MPYQGQIYIPDTVRLDSSPAAANEANSEVRSDGWLNELTLAGSRQDKTQAAQFVRRANLGREQLDSLYAQGGIARRIVDVPAKDMLREWFQITDDDGKGEEIIQAMEALHTQAHFTWAHQLARLHGGAFLLLLIDDGGELEQPVNENGIRKIDGMRAYDRWQVSYTSNMLVGDPSRTDFGQPERYQITPDVGTPYEVHASRMIRFRGLQVTDRMRSQNNYHDFSVLDPVYQALRNQAESQTGSAAIIQDFIQSALSIKNLSDMLASGQDGIVKSRLEILDLSRHILNTIVLDADEEQYTKHASNVGGLPELLDSHRMEVSAITGIPMTKLWTRSPGGLNSTGESDVRNYYDDLAGDQALQMGPPAERIVRLFMLQKEGPTRGREPKRWSIKWNPLWQPTEKEQADTRKSTAETDKIYIESGVLTAEEVAENRFGKGEYSAETVIDMARSRTSDTGND